jgi:hypothetical protein
MTENPEIPSTAAVLLPMALPVQALLEQPDQELRRIRSVMPRLLEELSGLMSGPGKFPLLRFAEAHKVVCLTQEEAGKAEQWFFIGDLHGDFFALHALLRHAEQARPDCKVLFLGDMVDRGDLPLECIFLMLEWGLSRPGRLAWIAGNHDVAFKPPVGQGDFTSRVSPAELLDVLNAADMWRGFRRQIGHFFIQLGDRLPRALLFPDGLLATHGGFPHSDLQLEGAKAQDTDGYLEWLNSDACLMDFTWNRINHAPKKFPDRYSSGSQYGFKDFEAFCALNPSAFPVQCMITGHEHPADGCTVHATYKVNPALTLVGFGFDDLRPMPGAYQNYKDQLYIARGVAGKLPVVVAVPVDHGLLQMMYPDIVIPTRAANAVESPTVPLKPVSPAPVLPPRDSSYYATAGMATTPLGDLAEPHSFIMPMPFREI